MPVTGADQLVHLTTRIETESASGGRGSGTGFFVNLLENIPVIITNKHVVAGAKTGWIALNLADANGEPKPGAFERVQITDFEQGWTLHPDPKVDLACFPLAAAANMLTANGKPPFFRAFGVDMIARQSDLDKLTAMESIVMLGYPSGLWDSKNNRPIIRRGITATPPYDNFEGAPQFVIDCACFPGSSGSPVIIFDNMHVDKAGNTNVTNRILLLGVLYAGPQWTAEGEIVTKTVPTAIDKQVAKTPLMINLGYCVRAEQLLWFEQFIKKQLAQTPKA